MWTSTYYNFWTYWNFYHKVTFDGPNKLIIVNPGEFSIDVEQDIYSDWKEWWQIEDNAKYPQALSVIGGEPLGGGQFVGSTFFLENGWRIRPPEEDTTIDFSGNIYTREAGESPVIATLGNWNNTITFTRSTLVFKVETSSDTSSISINPNQIAQAVWQYAVTGSMPADTYGDHIFRKLLTLSQYMATK